MRVTGALREGAIRARGVEGVRHTLPDFIVIGVRQGGTSSLNHYLRQHPLVRGSARKELRFFHAHWDRGLLWYRRFFPRTSEQRQAAREGRPFQAFEATPSYLYWPEVPERIARTLPDGRFVALLRDPVKRAYSDHQAMTRAGREHRPFDEAVTAELDAHESGAFRVKPVPEDEDGPSRGKLLAFGMYADALERWWRHVPPERLLVLISEEFFADEPATVRRITDFLDLPPHDGYDFAPRNQGGYVQTMTPATRDRLRAFFAPHNERLANLLGRDLGWS